MPGTKIELKVAEDSIPIIITIAVVIFTIVIITIAVFIFTIVILIIIM